ncbi:MAG: hypothetical protein HY204_12705 [Nitrospirae bacterium]|nr:hypothetical protein [Nitrospirota bacterium]
MPRTILRHGVKNLFMGGVTVLLLSACPAPSLSTNPASVCYRPHWAIPFDIQKVQRVAQQSFTTHTGSMLYVTIFAPGPFDRSFYFVMSPTPDTGSVAKSANIGIMLDTNRNGKPDCFILGGGTLPGARGKPVAYNFFAIDREGNGRIGEFISEDLDLDGDRIMDRNVQAILMEPDPEGHFQRGAYLVNGSITPIPKDGSAFLLRKPLWQEPFRFQDDDVTKMTLFAALQKIWEDLQRH